MTPLLLALAIAAPASASLEITLDPRVELAAALELLGKGEGPRAFAYRGPYGAALRAGTQRCAGHPAVAAYGRVRAGARPDWPAQGLVELTRCLDDGLLVAAREGCRSSALAAAAADFAATCGFAETLAAARPHAAQALEDLRRQAAQAGDPLAVFKDYTGIEPGATRVAPSPLLAPGKFWNGLERDGASFSIVAVRSPAPGEMLRFRWELVAQELWHENGHGVLDPLAAPSAAPEGFDASACYGSWPRCAREHMAQSLALRIAQRNAGKGRLKDAARAHRNPRLPLQARMAAALAGYEADRARFTTLPAYYPAWSAALGARQATGHEEERPATKAEPDSALAAALSLAQRDPAAGRAALEDLCAQRPGDGAALLSLAVLRRSDDKAAASALVERAVAAARAGGGAWLLPDALSTRATWKRADGDAAGARRDLNEALAVSPLDWPRRDETRAALR